MIINTFVVGPFMANCYIVKDDKTGEAMIVDPGGDGETLCEEIAAQDVNLKYIVNTHGHIDHIEANGRIRENFPDARICIHEADSEMLQDPSTNLSRLLGRETVSPAADVLLKESGEISIGELAFRILHVPGHSRGSVCLYCDKPDGKGPGVVFTGDTLFAMGIGRTDFPDPERSADDNFRLLVKGIRDKILSLPQDTVVYPGHGARTTVGAENNNPFLRLS